MTAGTLTRADIATRINQQIGLSRNESATIVESILDHMSDALGRQAQFLGGRINDPLVRLMRHDPVNLFG